MQGHRPAPEGGLVNPRYRKQMRLRSHHYRRGHSSFCCCPEAWQPQKEAWERFLFRLRASARPEKLRCPYCREDMTAYTEDDFVYMKGDDRPYCSMECVIVTYRASLRAPVTDRKKAG